MAVLYNMEPLAAMDVFYGGEKNGVAHEVFDKSREKYGFVLPPVLREFLEKYAFHKINKGQIVFLHPDDIRMVDPVKGGTVSIIVIGKIGGSFFGIDPSTKDYDIAVGKIEGKQVMWEPSNGMTLAGIMRMMFMSTLLKSPGKLMYKGEAIDAELNKHKVGRFMITPSGGNSQHISINFDEENNAFLIGEFDAVGKQLTILHVVPC